MNNLRSIRLMDLVSLASSGLRRNYLRSALTTGAIAVSVAIMMYLISLGLGLEQLTLGAVSRSSSLLSLGVTSGSKELQPLTIKNTDKIRDISGVKEVLPKVTAKAQVSLEKQSADVIVVGVDPNYLKITGPSGSTLKTGSYFDADDQDYMMVSSGFLTLFGLSDRKTPSLSFSIVLDPETFPNVQAMHNVVISGVIDSPQVQVYIPRKYLETKLGAAIPPYEDIKVSVATINDIDPVANVLISKGFKTIKAVDTIDEIKRVFFWIQATLAFLGLIAVLVASIGMFNTLTITLLERTREIGIMKALGIKRSDIRRLFMIESLLIGLVGGLAGIVIGLVLQQITIFMLVILASLVQGSVPSIFANQWYIVLLFVLLSLVISAITGILPAIRAANINPLEAIRYE